MDIERDKITPGGDCARQGASETILEKRQVLQFFPIANWITQHSCYTIVGNIKNYNIWQTANRFRQSTRQHVVAEIKCTQWGEISNGFWKSAIQLTAVEEIYVQSTILVWNGLDAAES